jgi:hypothetical protein
MFAVDVANSLLLIGQQRTKSNTYDVLNRLASVTRPISSANSNPQSTTYAYRGSCRTWKGRLRAFVHANKKCWRQRG